MLSLNLVIILVAHYLGDFICQPRKIADNKHKNIYWLLTHGLIYSTVLFVILTIIHPLSLGSVFLYVFINGVFHIGVDKISSHYTVKYYQQHNNYMMYNIVGLDQLAHIVVLLISYQIFW